MGDQLKVDAADILSYNAELAKYVLENPTESLPLVCHTNPLPGRKVPLMPDQWLQVKQGHSSLVPISSHNPCLYVVTRSVAC